MVLKVGVIGTGMIGQDHINRITNTLSGARVVAVTDIDRERVNTALKSGSIDVKVYNNGFDVINASEVDAVLVTTSGTHEDFVLASIAANKPVFSEKPLATTAEGCRRIVKAEIASGKRFVQVGYMRRYDRGYRALKSVIDSGRIGAPLMVHCAHRNPTVSNFSGDMSITDAFVHEIDVLRWLLNDDYVLAQVILPRNSRFAAKGLQDPHIMLLETTRGVRIDTEIFVNCQYGYDIQCQVVGDEATANLPEPSSVIMRSNFKVSTEISVDWKQRFIDSYDAELQEWINSTAGGEVNGPSAWDGYAAAITADACVEAKRSGQVVSISMPERPAFYGK